MTTFRKITKEELELINYLLKLSNYEELSSSIPAMVTDLKDGSMGGIKLTNNENNTFGRELITAKYLDKDKVDVLITLNLDQEDNLYELDFWKVNFDKLIKYPKPDQLDLI